MRAGASHTTSAACWLGVSERPKITGPSPRPQVFRGWEAICEQASLPKKECRRSRRSSRNRGPNARPCDRLGRKARQCGKLQPLSPFALSGSGGAKSRSRCSHYPQPGTRRAALRKKIDLPLWAAISTLSDAIFRGKSAPRSTSTRSPRFCAAPQEVEATAGFVNRHRETLCNFGNLELVTSIIHKLHRVRSTLPGTGSPSVPAVR